MYVTLTIVESGNFFFFLKSSSPTCDTLWLVHKFAFRDLRGNVCPSIPLVKLKIISFFIFFFVFSRRGLVFDTILDLSTDFFCKFTIVADKIVRQRDIEKFPCENAVNVVTVVNPMKLFSFLKSSVLNTNTHFRYTVR